MSRMLILSLLSFVVAAPATAQEPAPMPVQAPAKAEAKAPKEPPVYDEAADARADLAAALVRARRENKRVLIQWGANWCGWCKWLSATMKKDRAVRRTLNYEYETIHVDVGRFDKNMDLAKELGAQWKGIPFLTVLDADGKALVQQDTEPFETKIDGKSGHDANKLDAFLKEHACAPLEADAVRAAALEQAAARHKRVFLHFGAPWCGWCHRLEEWMRRPDIAPLLAKDFVDCKVDTDRMTGGQEMLDAYRQQQGLKKGGGIPWFVFLDEQGAVLAHSDGPQGNTGFPAQPEEIEHFARMLQAVRQGMTEADVQALAESLRPKPKQKD